MKNDVDSLSIRSCLLIHGTVAQADKGLDRPTLLWFDSRGVYEKPASVLFDIVTFYYYIVSCKIALFTYVLSGCVIMATEYTSFIIGQVGVITGVIES